MNIPKEESTREQLTVKELIEELKKWPEDAKVWAEGCDCYGEACAIEKLGDENEILINRL